MSQPYDRYPGPPPPSAPMPPGAWPPPVGYGYPPPPRRGSRAVVAWTIAGSLGAVVLVVAIAVGGYRMGTSEFMNVPATETSPPAGWVGIGDDEGLDAYAERCHDGDMAACDDLYRLAEPGSDYEYYGLTCGGRVNPRDVGLCILLG